MALSYFGIHESQAALGQILRPYENSTGDNDDKDVTFDELAGEARTFGLLAYHRPDGSIQLLKHFVANAMPVIAETTQVFTITGSILNYGNRAFSQIYILRGEIDKKQGNVAAAKAEFEKAVYCNTNLKAAQDALHSVSG